MPVLGGHIRMMYMDVYIRVCSSAEPRRVPSPGSFQAYRYRGVRPMSFAVWFHGLRVPLCRSARRRGSRVPSTDCTTLCAEPSTWSIKMAEHYSTSTGVDIYNIYIYVYDIYLYIRKYAWPFASRGRLTWREGLYIYNIYNIYSGVYICI